MPLTTMRQALVDRDAADLMRAKALACWMSLPDNPDLVCAYRRGRASCTLECANPPDHLRRTDHGRR